MTIADLIVKKATERSRQMTEQERAESVMGAPGTPTESTNFFCIGCGEKLTVDNQDPRPLGVYGTVVLLDKNGLGKPVDIWGHEKGKCVGSPILRALRGETAEAPETTDSADDDEAPTPIRHKRGEKPEAVIEPVEAPAAASN